MLGAGPSGTERLSSVLASRDFRRTVAAVMYLVIRQQGTTFDRQHLEWSPHLLALDMWPENVSNRAWLDERNAAEDSAEAPVIGDSEHATVKH